MGRPSDYSPELVAEICARMADGESLRSICRDENMPGKTTVFLWLGRHPEFADQYARARQARASAMEEEILQISDDDSLDRIEDGEGGSKVNSEFVARSRLKVDTRKWLMARMAPRVYGDKVTQEISGPDGGAIKQEIRTIELVAVPVPENMGGAE